MSPIVYGVFVVFGLIFIIISITARKRAKAAQTWPTTPGVVLSSHVDIHTSRDSDGDRNTTYKPVVAYRYEIMGLEYTGDRIAFGANTFSHKKSYEIVGHYPVGQPLTVHYNPDKPQDAVLEAEAKGGVASLIIGIVLMSVGVVMAVISFLG
jgi:hypothetical protein